MICLIKYNRQMTLKQTVMRHLILKMLTFLVETVTRTKGNLNVHSVVSLRPLYTTLMCITEVTMTQYDVKTVGNLSILLVGCTNTAIYTKTDLTSVNNAEKHFPFIHSLNHTRSPTQINWTTPVMQKTVENSLSEETNMTIIVEYMTRWNIVANILDVTTKILMSET